MTRAPAVSAERLLLLRKKHAALDVLSFAEVSDLLTALDAATAEAARLREALRRLANAADAVGVRHFDTDDMSEEVEAMQAATADARALIAPTPPAVATVDDAAIAEATVRALWKSVEIVPEGPESEYEFRWRKKSDGPAAGWCSGLPPATVAPEGPSVRVPVPADWWFENDQGTITIEYADSIKFIEACANIEKVCGPDFHTRQANLPAGGAA